MKGVVFREIIAIRDGKNHNAMKLRSLADFVMNRIKSAEKNPLANKPLLPVLAINKRRRRTRRRKQLTQAMLNFFDHLRGGNAVAVVQRRKRPGQQEFVGQTDGIQFAAHAFAHQQRGNRLP